MQATKQFKTSFIIRITLDSVRAYLPSACLPFGPLVTTTMAKILFGIQTTIAVATGVTFPSCFPTYHPSTKALFALPSVRKPFITAEQATTALVTATVIKASYIKLGACLVMMAVHLVPMVDLTEQRYHSPHLVVPKQALHFQPVSRIYQKDRPFDY